MEYRKIKVTATAQSEYVPYTCACADGIIQLKMCVGFGVGTYFSCLFQDWEAQLYKLCKGEGRFFTIIELPNDKGEEKVSVSSSCPLSYCVLTSDMKMT